MDSASLISNPLWSGPIAPVLSWWTIMLLVFGGCLCVVALRKKPLSAPLIQNSVHTKKLSLPSTINRENTRDFVVEVLDRSHSLTQEARMLILSLTRRIFATRAFSESDQTVARSELEELDTLINTPPKWPQ